MRWTAVAVAKDVNYNRILGEGGLCLVLCDLGQLTFERNFRDQSPVSLDIFPSVNDHAGWKEYLSKEYDIGDAADLIPSPPALGIPLESLWVCPKLFCNGESSSPTATRATPVATPAGRAELEAMLPVAALFPNAG